MKQTHINCEDVRCKICMSEHFAVGEMLDKLTGDKRHDHMGKFHSWLKRNGYEPETDYGWGTESFFRDDLMEAYAEDFKNGNSNQSS